MWRGSQSLYAAAFAPSGAQIAFGGFRGVVRVIDVDGREVRQLAGHGGAINDVDYSPDGRWIASASEDGTARIWRASDGALERVLRGGGGALRSARFSADGRRVVTAGTDGTVRISRTTGGRATVLYGHQGAVVSARFDRGGARVISAGVDGTVRLWSLAGGLPLVTIDTHVGSATAADLAPGGQRVASAGSDGVVRVVSCEVCGSFAATLAIAERRTDRDLSAVERRRFLRDDGG